MPDSEKIITAIREKFEGGVIESWESREETCIAIKEDVLYEVAKYIHESKDLKFDLMSNMTAVDYLYSDPPYESRFVAVYHFYSMRFGYRLRIKVPVSDPEKGVASLDSIWKSAGFFEREAYDMFGIRFIGHPDMRRLYMPEDWTEHPLRKDYPLKGHPGEELFGIGNPKDE